MQSETDSGQPELSLAAWLDDASEAQIQAHESSTGLSGARIWRVTIGERQLCLKRWPRPHPTRDELIARHGLLRHVFNAGFQHVPLPLLTQDGQSFQTLDDHLWELAPWLLGQPYDRERPQRTPRHAALRALAEFHGAASAYGTAKVGPAPGLQTRRRIMRQLVTGDLEALRHAVAANPDIQCHSVAVEMLAEIERALPTVEQGVERMVKVPLPLQWCLRDVKCEHVLFTGDQVSGLIDFGAAAVDSVT